MAKELVVYIFAPFGVTYTTPLVEVAKVKYHVPQGWTEHDILLADKTPEQIQQEATAFCEDLGKNHTDWILIHDDIWNPNIPVAGKGKIVEMFPLMQALAEKWNALEHSDRTDAAVNCICDVWSVIVDHYKR